MIGGAIGKRNDEDKKREQKEQAQVVQQKQEIQYAHMQQRNRGGLSLDFLSSAAGAESMDGMSVGEAREIDELSSEAKILTLALAELKMSNKKLSEIVDKPMV